MLTLVWVSQWKFEIFITLILSNYPQINRIGVFIVLVIEIHHLNTSFVQNFGQSNLRILGVEVMHEKLPIELHKENKKQ